MWSLIDTLSAPGPYDMLGVCRFLDHVPDRERAQRAVDRIGSVLLDGKLVALDPDEPGEVHGPLEFAPRPQSIARQLFDDSTISAHLDHLAGAQREDGGWMFNWLDWSAQATLDWRGVLTVEALSLLRHNGRLQAVNSAGAK